MHDHDLGEINYGLKPKEAKKDDSGGDHLHVAEAIRAGRPDGLGARGATHLQRAAGNAAAASLLQRDKDAAGEESPVKSVIKQGGEPLPKPTQKLMESKFNTDFSDVRVHADGGAADSAKSVGAHAYTVKNHVVFGQGKYDPGSNEGQKVLAHELTHVVQQRNGPVDGSSIGGGVKMSSPGDRFELEAEKTADQLMGGPPTHSNSGGGDGGGAQAMHVQRADEEKEDESQGMHVQRAAEEDEMAAMHVQRADEEKEDESQGMHVQRADEEKEDESQGMHVQRAAEEDEMAAMHVQRADEEKEDESQGMAVQRAQEKGEEEALPEEAEEKSPAQKLDVQRAESEELPE